MDLDDDTNHDFSGDGDEGGEPREASDPWDTCTYYVAATGAPIHDDGSDYATSKAARIWTDPNYVYRREGQLKKLIEGFNRGADNEEWKVLITRSKLSAILQMPPVPVDHSIISAFVERWNPRYNTFSMPFGEMTIMLHDMHIISGLPINGKTLKREWSDADVEAKVRALWTEANAKDIKQIMSYGGLHQDDVIRKMCSDECGHADAATMFLLLVLGSSLFMDKSTCKIDPRVLEFVCNHDKFGEYAWGVDVLAFLYRQLGEASRDGVKGMIGFSAVLQISENCTKGISQKGDNIWKQVERKYIEGFNGNPPNTRSSESCKARWQKFLFPYMNKWHSFVTRAGRRIHSVGNHIDEQHLAEDMFREDMKGKSFDFHSCYELCKGWITFEQPSQESFGPSPLQSNLIGWITFENQLKFISILGNFN